MINDLNVVGNDNGEQSQKDSLEQILKFNETKPGNDMVLDNIIVKDSLRMRSLERNNRI